MEVDNETTLKLIDKIPNNKIIVSESGISSKDDIKRLVGKVNAILVGTLFMNSKNIEKDMLSLICRKSFVFPSTLQNQRFLMK